MPIPRLASIAGLLALVAVAACGGADPKPARPAPGWAPVIDENFADPDILLAGANYYAYATQPQEGGRNITMATSADLKSWHVLSSDPLPRLPAWALAGRTWAPEVSAVPGGYVMYFTAHSAAPDVQCVGVARAASPAGPYSVVGSTPLVCPAEQGGAIDPSSYVDPDGRRYLLWKNDGNCCGKDTWLQVQPVSPDGTRVTGPPHRLVKQSLPWEGHLVEAPVLIRHGSTYVLFYSANDYGGGKYATGYATAPTIFGPYTKGQQPLMSSGQLKVIGPGGADVVEVRGGDVIAFHGWDPAISYRGMYVGRIVWKGDIPSVQH